MKLDMFNREIHVGNLFIKSSAYSAEPGIYIGNNCWYNLKFGSVRANGIPRKYALNNVGTSRLIKIDKSMLTGDYLKKYEQWIKMVK